MDNYHRFTADFETVNSPEDARVWSWGLCNIETLSYHSGIDMESFMETVSELGGNEIYFHNLKFDGDFIIKWLMANGYKLSKRKLKNHEFNTLISDKGVFYSIKVCFRSSGKLQIVTFLDSLKLIPKSIEQIAHDFKLPILKGVIEYNKHRPKGYIPDEKEKSYQRNDCEIAARALKIFFGMSHDKMTIGSNALEDYKNIITKKSFDRLFPKLSFRCRPRYS